MMQWTQPDIVALSAATPADRLLFTRLGVELTEVPPKASWIIKRDSGQLTLMRPDGVSLAIDFTAGKARHRAKESGFGAQTLSKALGIRAFHREHNRWPMVIDANGGLGQDAWAIASTGCNVTVVEQHPILHAMLEDGLARASTCENTADTASRVTLEFGDATDFFRQANDSVHAIYLDPMYPTRSRKKAESKKAAQFLQSLAGPAQPHASCALLQGALRVPAARVVVKRPANAPRLEGSDQFDGQITELKSVNTRYDVYHRPAAESGKT